MRRSPIVNTHGLKSVGVFLLVVSATLGFAAEKALDDGIVIQAMLSSLSEKEIAEQKTILRRITLFPTSVAVRNQVTVPGLATIMLDASASAELRREAIKAVVNLYGKDRVAAVFVPLLKNENITLLDTVVAIEKSRTSIFTANLFTAATLPQSPKDLIEPALIAGLRLWESHQCEIYFADLAISPGKDSAKVRLGTIAQAKSAQAVNSEIQIRALLVLGCLQPAEMLPAIMNRFAGESESLRLKIVHFFGLYEGEKTITPLIEIFKSDKSNSVRYGCLVSLGHLGIKQPRIKDELKKLYGEERGIESRQWILHTLYSLPGGREILIAIDKQEKDQRLRTYMRDLLQGKAKRPTVPGLFNQTQPPQSR